MTAEAMVLQASPRIAATLKPLLLLVGIAAAVAVGVSVVLWSQGPSYSLLYANLAPEDRAQIAQALEAAGIPYRLGNTEDTIEVPSERVSDARMKLAAQGLPESNGGFALLTKESGFGVSQFMEGARYQHALETELARTIASLRPVEGARVHLAVPRQSAFVRDRRPASASVFVQLRPGKRLEREQVEAIVHLVASSIPELEAQAVTVVDQHGRLLSAPKSDDELAVRRQHLELAHRLEEEYARRIEALLTPLVGPGRVRAQVVAQVDMSTTEEAREQYRPESQVVRSEQLSEQSSIDALGPQGIPGSLSNQPPAPGVVLPAGNTNAAAPQQAGAAAAQTVPAVPTNTARQSTRNYEIDRTLAYTRQPAGRLARLTVAVLVDNVRTLGPDGTVQEKPLTPEQLEHITRLVKDAVGFDEARGDSVNVVNEPFNDPSLDPSGDVEKPPLWEHPMVRDLARLLAGLILLIVLVLVVLRPLVRGLLGQGRDSQPQAAPPALPPAAEEQAAESPPEPQPQATVIPREAAQLQALAFEQQVAHARSLVSQDPRRVAQVVRAWVADDD
ncbi:MAG: flagellar basal-body MS-ring/collar protein FliF [Pseudomonadota bacterium]